MAQPRFAECPRSWAQALLTLIKGTWSPRRFTFETALEKGVAPKDEIIDAAEHDLYASSNNEERGIYDNAQRGK